MPQCSKLQLLHHVASTVALSHLLRWRGFQQQLVERQGTVHDLTGPDGTPSGRVLKAVRTAPLASLLIQMEWEWIVGACSACSYLHKVG